MIRNVVKKLKRRQSVNNEKELDVETASTCIQIFSYKYSAIQQKQVVLGRPLFHHAKNPLPTQDARNVESNILGGPKI